MDEFDEPPKVPIIGYVGAGGAVHLYAVTESGVDYVDRPMGMPDTTVAVEILGNSLGPQFNRWLVFYDSVRRSPTPDLSEALCVVGLPDGRELVRQLRRGSRDDLFNLAAPREPQMLDAKIEWAAPIEQMSRHKHFAAASHDRATSAPVETSTPLPR